jgi:hypothetical protein
MAIVTGLSDASSIDCPLAPIGDACVIDFRFTSRGFPPDAAYRVAVRETPDGTWTILGAPNVVHEGNAVSFDNRFEVGRDTPSSPPTSDLQFAVLVFLSAPENLPAAVAQLGESGADFAYVTAAVAVDSSLPSVRGGES